MNARRVDLNFRVARQTAEPEYPSTPADNIYGCLPGRFCPCTLNAYIGPKAMSQFTDRRDRILFMRIDKLTGAENLCDFQACRTVTNSN
jgi:hypothetical protein